MVDRQAGPCTIPIEQDVVADHSAWALLHAWWRDLDRDRGLGAFIAGHVHSGNPKQQTAVEGVCREHILAAILVPTAPARLASSPLRRHRASTSSRMATRRRASINSSRKTRTQSLITGLTGAAGWLRARASHATKSSQTISRLTRAHLWAAS